MERTYSFDEEAPPNDNNQPRFIYSRSISAAVYLSHRLCVVAMILVLLWTLFTNENEMYLGGVSWSYPKVYNWHPIMMVSGMVVCFTEALLAFRAFPFDKMVNRRVRFIWHTAAICMITVGFVAELKYANDRNKAVLWSFAQWMEVMTITLFLAQYCLGIYLFFYEGADVDMREVYIPFFAWLDIWVYVLGCFTVEANIVQRNTELGCTYNVTEIESYNEADPAVYYSDLPAGCRISSGLGIVILAICACTVYAALELKLPDISNTSAGWEAYKLTEAEQRKRRTWAQYFYSFWPFGKKKRGKRSRGARSGGQKVSRGTGNRKKSNWVEKNDGEGVYYYNTKTKESTKERPSEYGL